MLVLTCVLHSSSCLKGFPELRLRPMEGLSGGRSALLARPAPWPLGGASTPSSMTPKISPGAADAACRLPGGLSMDTVRLATESASGPPGPRPPPRCRGTPAAAPPPAAFPRDGSSA